MFSVGHGEKRAGGRRGAGGGGKRVGRWEAPWVADRTVRGTMGGGSVGGEAKGRGPMAELEQRRRADDSKAHGHGSCGRARAW